MGSTSVLPLFFQELYKQVRIITRISKNISLHILSKKILCVIIFVNKYSKNEYIDTK
jgi:hypothetical protein